MFQGKVILVVDDEADLREILRDELVYEGATVVEAANGIEAMGQLSRHSFDAVLSDIRMPGGDGATLARNLRSQHPEKPVVILITGFADLYVEEAYALGADGYVTKPFHLDDLKHTLKRLLKDPQERWSLNSPGEAHQIQIPLTIEQALRNNRLRLGRGGIFLQAKPEQIRPGDWVDLNFLQMPAIRTQVRWVRAEINESQRPGLGLEFLQVPDVAIHAFNQAVPAWQQEPSFIPKN